MGNQSNINMHDFSDSKYPAPITQWERTRLSLIYFPYLAVPIALLMDSLFSSVYRNRLKQS